MSKVMNAVFGIGIAVVIYLVILLGIHAFYPAPKIEAYNCTYGTFDKCPYPVSPSACLSNMTKDECAAYESAQQATLQQQQREYDSCFNKFQADLDIYNRNVFFITTILGSIIIIISYFLLSMTSISAGVAFSGLALIVYGFAVGWNSAGDKTKFIVGLIAAIIVIIFGVLVNKKSQKKK